MMSAEEAFLALRDNIVTFINNCATLLYSILLISKLYDIIFSTVFNYLYEHGIRRRKRIRIEYANHQ
ncbi:hypothetical protein T4A_20 [Trichinella pseudospiralis]|uniref:Uncharacterized protein n=1 Tax=Trichinella pseudospiralis TaxID=6337 RepID=A0A0V1EQ36_TRIPS|nr:hypothetical protein T4A_20 [Trichinella pseudospiralis]